MTSDPVTIQLLDKKPISPIPFHMSLLVVYLYSLFFSTVPTQPIGFNLNNVTDEPRQLMAEWSQPVPPNGVITAYTVTCTLSTNQVC